MYHFIWPLNVHLSAADPGAGIGLACRYDHRSAVSLFSFVNRETFSVTGIKTSGKFYKGARL